VQYPAPGQPELASALPELLNPAQVGLDQNWGLDHGAWSVIKHLYPQADIPVVQMSLDMGLSPAGHAELAARLVELRNKGVLIIGSGNTVHNLGRVAWDRLNEVGYAYDWAEEARLWINEKVSAGDLAALCQYEKQGSAMRLAVPTSEHYLPLLYSLAIRQVEEPLVVFNDKALAGSLAMTSFRIG
jgi:4,5-DOPA dioxygenase extradiol